MQTLTMSMLSMQKLYVRTYLGYYTILYYRQNREFSMVHPSAWNCVPIEL